jgi:hypothetical protein
LEISYQFINTQNEALRHAVAKVFNAFAFWQAPLIFLKQLPSAEPPLDQAAYQAYVTAGADITAYRSVAFFNGFKVALYNPASAPIASSYGITTGSALTPLLACYVDLDFEIGTGVESPI